MIRIRKTTSVVEKEPLKNKFGFKGGGLSELWQVVVRLESENDISSIGLGVQSVLWSAPDVYNENQEENANKLMYDVTQKALRIVEGVSFNNPLTLLDSILEEVYNYAKNVTENANLSKTFVLNALVPLDNAVWLLYAYEKGIDNFTEMIPNHYRSFLNNKHKKIANIPLITYGTTDDEITDIVNQGYFFLKIKIGHPGSQEEMIKKDKQRLKHIHEIIQKANKASQIQYYLDANGRYLSKGLFLEFLDFIHRIGVLERTAIVEEPFTEKINVSDIGVCIAGDESAHTDKDVLELIQLGYSAIALKPMAKTLSMTLKMLEAMSENNLACFCADLTVNPVMVEWNKNVAARISSFPGLSFNLLETNGAQNYAEWDKMCRYNPVNEYLWTKDINGFFELGDSFFERSGGIFEKSEHYQRLFKNNIK